MKILLTGCAGFIGSHTLDRLLAEGHEVIGVDNFDPFYSRARKNANLAPHVERADGAGAFELVEGDLADAATYTKIRFLADGMRGPPSADRAAADSGGGISGMGGAFDAVIHIAAKAGVRPSIEDPEGYQRANVLATQKLLEFAREQKIPQFVFASSSSVYGNNPDVPWGEDHAVLRPISPYAGTKVSCELLGHIYSHLYGIRFLGLRFFTVYGPRQRPDLAINKFVRLIEAGEPIPVFGDGGTRRDYTYIADTVDGILGALRYDATNYEIINLGNDRTITLAGMIATIEEVVGKKAHTDRREEQPGDVPQTWADITKARRLLGYNPQIPFTEGVRRFHEWWRAEAGSAVFPAT